MTRFMVDTDVLVWVLRGKADGWRLRLPKDACCVRR